MSYSKLSILASGSIALALATFSSGCKGSGDAGTAGTQSLESAPVSGGGNHDGGSGGAGVAVGEACPSRTLCLAVRFVSYTDSNGSPVANASQVATIVHTLNQHFAQCGIGFQIETYDQVNPADYGLSYGAQSQSETSSIRRTFQQSHQLLAVNTGPWGTAVNAWTSLPGEENYGAIMEASIVGYGGGIIHAHEFGHYLGLDHGSSTANLMSPVIYTSSTALTSSQCATAVETVHSYWAAMLR